MKNEQIARLTYEADRAIRARMGQTLPEWGKHEASLKTEWRSKVASFKKKDGITPRSRHESWVKDMITAGWVQGQKIDHDKKTHPAICPYDNLPEEVHLLDDVFVTIIETCVEIAEWDLETSSG